MHAGIRLFRFVAVAVALCTALSRPVSAQTTAQAKMANSEPVQHANAGNPVPAGVTTPPGYVIGADDLLFHPFLGRYPALRRRRR